MRVLKDHLHDSGDGDPHKPCLLCFMTAYISHGIYSLPYLGKAILLFSFHCIVLTILHGGQFLKLNFQVTSALY